jgi:cytochrome c oxidase cbb3-type subunit 3/ubiquinol-cytochrome c reductase cytochrome c subunit
LREFAGATSGSRDVIRADCWCIFRGVRFALLVVIVGFLAACQNAPAKPPVRRDAGPGAAPTDAALNLATVQPTYTKLCAPCHGADLKGYAADFAPSLINPTFLESASDDFLRRSIVFGRPGTSMAAYGKALGGPLDDSEVDKLVAWIRTFGPKQKPLPAFGGGDAARGANVYAEYCKTCHGDSTKRGEAPHLANTQWLMNATDSFIRYAIEAGRPGTKMPAFGPVMDKQQIDDVTAFVRTLASQQPLPQLLPEPTGKEPLVINPKGGQPAFKPRDNRFIGIDVVAKALAEKKKMIILDARAPSDWRRAHITGAVSMPHYDPKRLDEVVEKHKDVYVIAYCACPHHLSGLLVDELKKRGHNKALVLDEGINLWHQKNYPITAAEGVKPPAFEPHNHGHDHSHHGHGH